MLFSQRVVALLAQVVGRARWLVRLYQSSYISGWGPAHTRLRKAGRVNVRLRGYNRTSNVIRLAFCILEHGLTLIGNESIVILRVAALLDQDVNLLSLQLLTWHRAAAVEKILYIKTRTTQRA